MTSLIRDEVKYVIDELMKNIAYFGGSDISASILTGVNIENLLLEIENLENKAEKDFVNDRTRNF